MTDPLPGLDILTPEFIRKNAFLSKEDLNVILDNVSTILDKEYKLIEIKPSKIYFLGDTHGNLPITIHACKHIFPSSKNSNLHSLFDKIVFLGDFIDRGPNSVENLNFLMSIKAKYPEKIILIRGNHETREINIRFDFYEKILRRYGMKIFEKYNNIFSKLPIAILTWNNIFAIHGGLPENLEKLSDLNELESEVDPEDLITFQVLWNDPVEKDGWFFRNFRGKYSKKFGRDAFQYFIKKHDINLVLRAHEHQKKGFKEYFGAKLISLDSTKKRKKQLIKVFILKADGNYEVADVEHYEDKKFSKAFQ